MLSIFYQAFSILLQPGSLLAMLLGAVIGLVVGVIPGIGGIFAICLLMPIAYTMDPVFGIVLLVTILSVTGNAGSVTAILVGVPGDSVNAATIIDGYQMTKQGQAGRALGACLTASAIGGVFGAIVLIAVMPIMRALILAFGHPEMFMLAVLGISFVALLGEGSMLKACVVATLGFVVAFVGYNPITGTPRYDMGLIVLYDGIKLIPITMGLFAIPELMGLYLGEESIEAEIKVDVRGGIIEGVRDAFRHWFLVMRCSVMGSIIGMIPGLGANTAIFLAYAHAKQTSKHSDRFGHGAVEGVIAPESASNAKEGGALVPTLGFGIPGSTATAILMGAFIILGLQPGPVMLRNQPELIMVMALLTAITNVFGSALCLLSAKWLIKLASIRAQLLVPWILMFIMIAAYVPDKSFTDVFFTIGFGMLGMGMKNFGYPRVVFLLVVILAETLELNFWMGYERFGMTMFSRPVVLVFVALIILTISFQHGFARRREGKTA